MRNIKFIAIHCSATSQTETINSMIRYWKEQLHWNNPGYHYIIKPCGEVVQLLEEDKPSNGVAGFNSVTVNICYIGGIRTDGSPIDNRTPEQKAAIVFLLEQLKERYPKAKIQGHRDFSPDKNGNGIVEPSEWIKNCPCFDAKSEYKNIR